MAKNLFSVPIFFIVFRETLEAVIIISVLLGLVEQIVRPQSGASSGRLFVNDWRHPNHPEHQAFLDSQKNEEGSNGNSSSDAVPELRANLEAADELDEAALKKLIRKLRIQVS